ncbi:MAG: hypothetical protein DRN68_06805, partial [Thaumarchaeota archaeon]
FDTGSDDVSLEKIYWHASTNENTSVTFYVRSSVDNETWSSWFWQDYSGSSIYAPDARYVQYKIELNTTNQKQTPYVYEVNITYKVTTIGWKLVQSGGTALTTTNNPINCGILNQTNQNCTVTWQVMPNNVGDYALRIVANSTETQRDSEIRNITVKALTYLTEFTTNQSLAARGDSVLLKARLLDDLSQPMEGYNITFIDETENYVIGSNLTDSDGYAYLVYIIPQTASLGSHVLNASFNGSESEYLFPSSEETTITISSKPKITNVSASPEIVGFGSNVTIRANVTDEVGVDKVFANVTLPSGASELCEMHYIGSDYYECNFSNTWKLGNYTFFIIANNTDGMQSKSEEKSFLVNATLDIAAGVEKEEYKANEAVLFSNCRSDWWNCSWEYRKTIELSSSVTASEFPVKLTIDTKSLIEAGKLNNNCSDLRFAYERPIYELPITIDNSGFDARVNETIKIEITDTEITSKITSENEIRIFNQSVDYPYERSDYLPFWVEQIGEEGVIIWVKVPYVPANGEATIYLYYGNPGASDAQNYNATFDEIIGEAGKFSADHNWQNINFQNGYEETPVVILTMNTNNEGGSGTSSAAVARLKDLDTSGFSARAEEYPDGDGLHATEEFSYIAMKKGVWIIAGKKIVANTTTADSSYSQFTFPQFSDPVILTQINSYNEAGPSDSGSHTRQRNPSYSSSEVKVEEDGDAPHTTETIGYIVIDPSGLSNVFEAGKTPAQVTDAWYDVTFSYDFSSTPVTVAKIMTENGGDECAERMQNLNADGFEVHAEEAPGDDGPHPAAEIVGYLAFPQGLIRGIAYKQQPSINIGNEIEIGYTYQELDYWIERGCNTNATELWVKVPVVDKDRVSRIQMYYGNPDAESKSDEIGVFNYSSPSGTYVVLGVENANLDVISYANTNEISLGSFSTILDEGESVTISSTYVSSGSLLKSSAPVSTGTQSSGDGAPLTPVAFYGKLFAVPLTRYDPIYFDIYALDDATIKVYNSSGDGWNLINSFTVSKGSSVTKSYPGVGNSDGVIDFAYMINSTGDILVFRRQGNEDYSPLIPVAKELYLVPSNYLELVAVYNDTDVDIYYSDGTHVSLSLDAGEYWNSTSLGSQGNAPAARIVASKPVFAYQLADGDGTEATPALTPEFMDRLFYFPQGVEDFVIASLTN